MWRTNEENVEKLYWVKNKTTILLVIAENPYLSVVHQSMVWWKNTNCILITYNLCRIFNLQRLRKPSSVLIHKEIVCLSAEDLLCNQGKKLGASSSFLFAHLAGFSFLACGGLTHFGFCVTGGAGMSEHLAVLWIIYVGNHCYFYVGYMSCVFLVLWYIHY